MQPARQPPGLAKSNVAKRMGVRLLTGKQPYAGKVRFLLIVGDKDLTYASHAPFIEALNELKVPYEYEVLPGVEHNLGKYYEQTVTKLVKFVTAGFADFRTE
jgi:hypothetical protein